MTREMIKLNARQQIKGKIGILFVMSIIIAVITWAASLIPMAGSIVNMVLITPAFTVSMIMIYLKLSNSERIKVGDIFDGFYHFWGAFKVTFLVGLFTFLWSLLFIVPGIIKSYSYSMAIYIYAENKEMGALQAIRESKKLMDGHKMDLFVLMLSFIGWYLLTLITFGIIYIYVGPYMQAAMVNFYKSLLPVEAEYTVED